MVIQKMKALEIKLLVLLIGSTLNSQVKNTRQFRPVRTEDVTRLSVL